MNLKRLALIGCLTAGLLLGTTSWTPAVLADTSLNVTTNRSGVTAEGLHTDRGVPLGGTPVFLTVEDLSGNIVHLDQTATDEHGIYHFDWTMSPKLPSGLYRVTVSTQGEQQSTLFNYVSSSSDGTISPIDLGPYRFTGELNAGKKQAVLYDKDTGLNVEQKSGVTVVTLNESKALYQIRSAASGTTYLTISVPTDDKSARVTVSKNVIDEMIDKFGREARLLVAAETASLDLPLDAIHKTLMDKVLTTADGSLQITIEPPSQSETDRIDSMMQMQKITHPLVSPVKFGVWVNFGGQTVPIIDFGNRFVQFSIDLTGAAIAAGYTSSALYDHPQNDYLTPTPSKLYRDAVGHGKLVIKRTGPGIYVPVQEMRSFTDISSARQKEKILELSARHIINGRTPTTFDPDGNITRAEIATLMMLSLGLSDKQGTSLFRDVPQKAWFTKPVAIGSTLGLISGYDAWTFAPDDPISREQMASLMVRCLSFVETRPYVDTTRILGQVQDRAAISSWAREDVALAIQSGILDQNTTLVEPRRPATRAESAEMLYNLLQYLKLI
jgi:hypothetical protein